MRGGVNNLQNYLDSWFCFGAESPWTIMQNTSVWELLVYTRKKAQHACVNIGSTWSESVACERNVTFRAQSDVKISVLSASVVVGPFLGVAGLLTHILTLFVRSLLKRCHVLLRVSLNNLKVLRRFWRIPWKGRVGTDYVGTLSEMLYWYCQVMPFRSPWTRSITTIY